MMLSRLSLFPLFCGFFVVTHSWTIRELGSVAIPNPAFTSVQVHPGTGRYDVTCTTFSSSPLVADRVMVIRDVGGQIAQNGASNLEVEVLSGGHKWPNELDKVPGESYRIKQTCSSLTRIHGTDFTHHFFQTPPPTPAIPHQHANKKYLFSQSCLYRPHYRSNL